MSCCTQDLLRLQNSEEDLLVCFYLNCLWFPVTVVHCVSDSRGQLLLSSDTYLHLIRRLAGGWHINPLLFFFLTLAVCKQKSGLIEAGWKCRSASLTLLCWCCHWLVTSCLLHSSTLYTQGSESWEHSSRWRWFSANCWYCVCSLCICSVF